MRRISTEAVVGKRSSARQKAAAPADEGGRAGTQHNDTQQRVRLSLRNAVQHASTSGPGWAGASLTSGAQVTAMAVGASSERSGRPSGSVASTWWGRHDVRILQGFNYSRIQWLKDSMIQGGPACRGRRIASSPPEPWARHEERRMDSHFERVFTYQSFFDCRHRTANSPATTPAAPGPPPPAPQPWPRCWPARRGSPPGLTCVAHTIKSKHAYGVRQWRRVQGGTRTLEAWWGRGCAVTRGPAVAQRAPCKRAHTRACVCALCRHPQRAQPHEHGWGAQGSVERARDTLVTRRTGVRRSFGGHEAVRHAHAQPQPPPQPLPARHVLLVAASQGSGQQGGLDGQVARAFWRGVAYGAIR